jgi:hypothetical protein
VDRAGGLLPCRVHLTNEKGQPQRAGELPFWRDHFVCPGDAEIELPAGKYEFTIERGPEYQRHIGLFTLEESEDKRVEVGLERAADLANEGWYSGDLHVHRAIEDMPLLMQAEDLHIAPVITWWNNRNYWADRSVPSDPLIQLDGDRFYQLMAGEDEREGGALMFFNLKQPLAIAGSTREYPSPVRFIKEARQYDGAWIDIEKPFWWDVPVWLATGLVDSIGLANNHMCRSQMYETEAWGRPRDAERLPPPRGNGFWTQEIYYHILNCGLRIPPSAGSASGVLPNPLGYDRAYVYVGSEMNYQAWWDGLKAGRVFVTNGPLLRVTANGQLPGHVFTEDENAAVSIDIQATLTSTDPVSEIQIIKNGRTYKSVPWDNTSTKVSLGSITFRQSGWFLARVVADVKHTFRFASTGPFYVEVGDSKERVSRQSTQFFLDWVDERIKRVPNKLEDRDKLQEVLSFHEVARAFWLDRIERANAE